MDLKHLSELVEAYNRWWFQACEAGAAHGGERSTAELMPDGQRVLLYSYVDGGRMVSAEEFEEIALKWTK